MHQNEFFLRPARPGDLPALLLLENRSFSGDRLSRRSFRRLLSSPTAAFVLAETAGNIAGYVLVFFRRGSLHGRIYSLAVGLEYRGQGLGEQLMLAAEKLAVGRGCQTIGLEVRSDNTSAANLYRRLGYILQGRRLQYYEDGQDAMVWRKFLST